jgi:predicted nucleic acid-binding protein
LKKPAKTSVTARKSSRRFLIDTSCIIAAVCPWHESHESTAATITARLDAGEQLVIAAHSLAEGYSVLTRLPAPYRLSPEDAATLVGANFADGATVIALTAADYKRLVARAPERGVSGGRTYDAIVVECARKAGVSTIVTLNRKDFASLLPREGGITLDPL